jgi:hypothetical protein
MKQALLGLLFATAVAMHAQNVPTWKQEQKTDAFRGTSHMQFTLEGKFLTPPQRTTLSNPVMVVRCIPGNDHNGHTRGKYISGYIATGAVVDTSVDRGGNSSIKVQFRRDDGKIQYASWSRSTDFSAIFLKSVYAPFGGSGFEEFGNLLYAHFGYHKENTNPQVHKIVFDVPEYLGGEVVMQFDLPDSTAVADACGVIWHK